jgi:hypothetical protein
MSGGPPIFFQDTIQDEVLEALEVYRKAGCKKAAYLAKAMLLTLADWYRYQRLETRGATYKARCIGESVIMKVPPHRRGALARYRGRFVRIISTDRDGFATYLRFAPLKLSKAQEAALIPFSN